MKLGEPKEITSRRSFFESSYGTLAILPAAKTREDADGAGRFLLLRTGSINPARQPQTSWLQINHHNPSSTGSPTHAGVLIIKILKTAQALPVTFYRNANWTRKDEPSLPSIDRPVRLIWSDFTGHILNWTTTNVDMSSSDRVIGGPWHANPSRTTVGSWECRWFWPAAANVFQSTVTSVTSLPKSDMNVSVNARLLRFTPTPTPHSTSPLVFPIATSDCIAFFIMIYIPSNGDGVGETTNWCWVRLY